MMRSPEQPMPPEAFDGQAKKEELKACPEWDPRIDAYLLDEMDEDESERFERHYFECDGCALAVRAGQEMIKAAERLGKKLIDDAPEAGKSGESK